MPCQKSGIPSCQRVTPEGSDSQTVPGSTDNSDTQPRLINTNTGTQILILRVYKNDK